MLTVPGCRHLYWSLHRRVWLLSTHTLRTSLSSQDPQMTDSYIHQKPIQSSFDRVTIRIFLPHKVAWILKHNLQRNLVSDARSAECQHYQEKHLLNVLHSCEEWSEQTSIITLRGAIVVWSSKAEMLTEHVARDRIRGQLQQRLHCLSLPSPALRTPLLVSDLINLSILTSPDKTRLAGHNQE